MAISVLSCDNLLETHLAVLKDTKSLFIVQASPCADFVNRAITADTDVVAVQGAKIYAWIGNALFFEEGTLFIH